MAERVDPELWLALKESYRVIMRRVDSINQAFKSIHRVDFVPEGLKDQASIDIPLPIGFGQTISQPTTVRLMMEWLEAQPGEKVLDIGAGSGWTTALLSSMIGPKGKVFAVEKIPELVKFGTDNCKQAGIKNISFFTAGTHLGLSDFAPYDRILVSAAASKLPKEFLNQLKVGGRLVIPINNSIFVIDKNGYNSFESTEHHGFVFVPLV